MAKIIFHFFSAVGLSVSDDEVAADRSGEITLTNTGEIYRCAIVSH